MRSYTRVLYELIGGCINVGISPIVELCVKIGSILELCIHLRLNGLSDGADLVNFEQQTVAGFLLYSLLNAFGVCHCQVVPYDLDVHRAGELRPVFPVVLVEGVLNRLDWIKAKRVRIQHGY